MTLLTDLAAALAAGDVRVVDLTQPLSERTPVLQLPPPFANTPGLSRREISRYDDRGPAWAWDVLEIGEHVGTHFDAPIHWITGRDGEDVASVPPARLVGPAVVIDHSAEAAQDPDHLLTVDHIRAFEAEHGAIPDGAWLLLRTGWDARAHDQDEFLNGGNTPGPDAECAQYLAHESGIVGFGCETVGTDAGHRALVRPAVPGPQLPARRRQVRHHAAREPRRAAADGRGDRRRPAQAGRRHRQPVARARLRLGGGAQRDRDVLVVVAAVLVAGAGAVLDDLVERRDEAVDVGLGRADAEARAHRAGELGAAAGGQLGVQARQRRLGHVEQLATSAGARRSSRGARRSRARR